MLISIHPKLPMRSKPDCHTFYVDKLGFIDMGTKDYPDYLILSKDKIEIHFFLFPDLNPTENYGQVYLRVKNIEEVYATLVSNKVKIHPNAPLQIKPWGVKEFSILDPDYNLLTFGEYL
jgi:hypothetical protein